MRRIPVAYVVNSLNAGGTEKLVVEMALAYSETFDMQVYCLDEPGLWASRLGEAGIPVRGLGRRPGIDPTVALELARGFRAAGTRIVHAHQCTAWFYAALSRLMFPAPRLILQEHGRFWPEPDRPRRRLLNRVLINRLTHRFVAVSRDIAERLVRYEGVPGPLIEVIHNGVSRPDRFDADEARALRKALGIAPDEFVVGTVGRLDPIKNLPMLVRAIDAASRVHGRVRGLVVGEGPERARVEGLLRDCGLSDRILLAGHRDDARRLVGCMDLFALTSYSEGTSVALLEAMSAAVPVAVTAVGGNPEVVVDGETGWLIPSDDAQALADVIGAAMSRPDLRRRLGEGGRSRFHAEFDMTRMLAAYRDMYVGLAGGRP
jgi:glycosyltransferase involved in cell wall biosynthesis